MSAKHTPEREQFIVDNYETAIEAWKARALNAERTLELIATSDSFNGGTFVRELQGIARDALAKAKAK